jgi:hypothetical protein
MADPTPLHPRALIRRAVVRVLRQDAATAALMADRIFPNRTEHWLADELPACGVYTLSETPVESDVSPGPDERRIDLAVEVLARMASGVDDALDSLCLAVERALQLDAVGAAMTALVDEARAQAGKDPLPPVVVDGIPRTSAVDTLLVLEPAGTEIGIAVDGNRQIGVAVMNFGLEYAAPRTAAPDAEFLLAVAGWDVEPHDNVIDMESRAAFEPAPAREE